MCVCVCMSVMGVRAFERENDSERQNERAYICVFVYCWLAGCFGWGAFRSKNTHRHTHQQGDGWHLFCVLFFAKGNAQRSFDFPAIHTLTHYGTRTCDHDSFFAASGVGWQKLFMSIEISKSLVLFHVKLMAVCMCVYSLIFRNVLY